ncbi:YeeE/YedE thiosulfate transporter family protein [Rhodovulum sp. DZ06]|uniref:YeeE/YedE thiosulfate transporter family protein n=1 Tax=Rhodovulum sp. DZ06 TaxID=3425126 RepID=UPI003D352EDE
MFEDLGLEGWTPVEAALLLGAVLGLVFGLLAQRSRFCLRRALVGETGERRGAAAVWLTALATAMIGMQVAVAQEWIYLEDTRFAAETLPLGALIVGGLMFGAGMVLTRGCASRLTVLAASGNLRAGLCVLVFAVAAHATMKGALAWFPPLLAGGELEMAPTLDAATGLPGWAFAAAVAALAVLAAAGRKASVGALAAGAVIGLLVPAAWVGTGYVLLDDFDPIAFESLAFTRPGTEALFWTVAGTAVPAGFGVGFIGGVLGGAFLAAAGSRELRFASFEAPGQAGRYLLGALLMGVGGVVAGGCTVGAGLAGVPTLGVSALAALVAMALGAVLTDFALGLGAPRGARAVAAE